MPPLYSVLLVAVALVALGSTEISADTSYDVVAYYVADTCAEGAPNRVDVGSYDCDSECVRQAKDWRSVQGFCEAENYTQVVDDAFVGAAYVLVEAFDSECTELEDATAFQASGTCSQVITFVDDWGYATYAIAKEDGRTLSIRYYNDSKCESTLLESVAIVKGAIYTEDMDINQTTLNSTSCDERSLRWTYFAGTTSSVSASSSFSGNDDSSASTSSGSVRPSSSSEAEAGSQSSSLDTSSSGSNVGAIVGLVAGVVVVTLLGALVIVWFCRRARGKRAGSGATGPTTLVTYSQASDVAGQNGLWSDDVITAKRISRRDVHMDKLLSRGAFGEVYSGTFDGNRVAVKMLLPENRGVIRHVNAFLSEAKMTASMDHPRIIGFIGVAWNSLSDVCVVMEFMDGGDLRALLSRYEASKHPVGIDREKAAIALHVCHALTYLHSLSPLVIHRDLKSRNILLTEALEAKLTDFGISRERHDQTMTAGVGTSLWMAPEVMLGERYDDKADMFSFGVVLSELDVHTLPYAQSKDKSRDSNGKPLPDAVLLQQVARGSLRVDFSESSPRAIVELGLACVSVDPRQRPSAAEALYSLQVALALELNN
jgi:serine/threonine-protein kinase TNNI3K